MKEYNKKIVDDGNQKPTEWDFKAPIRMVDDSDLDSEELESLRQQKLKDLGW